MTLVNRLLDTRWAVAIIGVLPVPLRLARWWLLRDDVRENRRDSWGRLRSPAEIARYDAVRAAVEAYGADGFVLDVGCSQGILAEGLTYGCYLGVDRSPEAIRIAAGRRDDRTHFLVAEGSRFTPERAPDVVVLNEVAYYLPDPLGTVEHYAGLLAERGVVVVSVYTAWSTRRLIRRLNRRLEPVELRLARSGYRAWIVATFRPRAGVRPG